MQRFVWRLAVASGLAACLALGAVPAGASGSDGRHRPPPGPVQVAHQGARTEQHADSSATSEQFLPVNANVPVQILSFGSNGGDTRQSNDSTAKSAAVNEAETSQGIDQDQQAGRPHGPEGHGPDGHDGRKGHDDRGDKPERRDCRKGHDGDRRSGHGPEGPFQGAEQHTSTDQDAHSSATSKQFLPVNVNAPIQVLSFGSNGGDTKQSNDSTAQSFAGNEARTSQWADQDQAAGWQSGPKGHDDGRSFGHGPQGPFQGAEQHASTDQDAHSSATSEQFLPVNVNAPIQVLSFGSNGGDTRQSNDSTAKSAAVNEADTLQSASQDQGAGSGAAFQGADQSASTDQDAHSSATSTQIVPVNANVPVQILSFGHNGGDTAQSNSSSAQSNAFNQAGTFQGLGQAQGLLG